MGEGCDLEAVTVTARTMVCSGKGVLLHRYIPIDLFLPRRAKTNR